MNKNRLFLVAILMLLALPQRAHATEQYPDYVIYQGVKYEMYVDWGHPSPLQTYYLQTDTPSPFHSWSTANYRGHIATWELRDDKLFLVLVDTRSYTGRTGTYYDLQTEGIDTSAAPGFFGIASIDTTLEQQDGAVFANWFSGVLMFNPIEFTDDGKKHRKNRKEIKDMQIAYVHHGQLIDHQIVTKHDYKRIQNISEKDTSNHELMDKYRILYLNECYLSYYLRMGLSEDIVHNAGHDGRLKRRNEFVPAILARYDNDPTRWPFCWTNFTRNGAPSCTYVLQNDSLFLTRLQLLQGLGFYECDTTEVALEELFDSSEVANGKVLANWMNGDYLVEYGKYVKDEYDMELFEMSRQQHIEVKQGIVVGSKYTPRSFEEDSMLAASTFAACDTSHLYAVTKNSLLEPAVGAYPPPAVPPHYDGDSLQAYFDAHPISNEKADGLLFRVAFAVMVNCQGEAGQWRIISRGQGILFELANEALDIASQMPNRWTPAKDADGNPIDCWQVMTATINNHQLTQVQVCDK